MVGDRVPPALRDASPDAFVQGDPEDGENTVIDGGLTAWLSPRYSLVCFLRGKTLS